MNFQKFIFLSKIKFQKLKFYCVTCLSTRSTFELFPPRHSQSWNVTMTSCPKLGTSSNCEMSSFLRMSGFWMGTVSCSTSIVSLSSTRPLKTPRSKRQKVKSTCRPIQLRNARLRDSSPLLRRLSTFCPTKPSWKLSPIQLFSGHEGFAVLGPDDDRDGRDSLPGYLSGTRRNGRLRKLHKKLC